MEKIDSIISELYLHSAEKDKQNFRRAKNVIGMLEKMTMPTPEELSKFYKSKVISKMHYSLCLHDWGEPLADMLVTSVLPGVPIYDICRFVSTLPTLYHLQPLKFFKHLNTEDDVLALCSAFDRRAKEVCLWDPPTFTTIGIEKIREFYGDNRNEIKNNYCKFKDDAIEISSAYWYLAILEYEKYGKLKVAALVSPGNKPPIPSERLGFLL